jgi:hypothetical protein
MRRYHEHSTSSTMSIRLSQFLLLACSFAGTGAVVTALSSARAITDAPVAASAMPAESAIEAVPTLLPTVVVRPDAPIPTLATITVRPDRSIATGSADEKAPEFALREAGGSVMGTLSNVSFDMPYYSFGRRARQVSKE